MSCRDMGGPCDFAVSGSTPEEMMQTGETHVRDLAGQGDAAHQEVLLMMEQTKSDPAAGEKWFSDFAAKFAALPEA